MPADGFRGFSSILCPVDFSEHSGLALRYAALLARRSNARLTVLFVNDPLLVAAAAAAYNVDTLGAASQEELRRFVADSLRGAARNLRLEYQTALGKPARTILGAADRCGCDVVVVGTKGLNGARRLFFGSTTSEILRRTKVPVLAVPIAAAGARRTPARGWPGRQILAPVALDAHAENDLRQAAAIATWMDASLVAMHVVPSPAAPAWFRGDMGSQLQHSSSKAHLALEALASTLKVTCTTVVATGYPPDEIAREAGHRRAGLVVMALRGGSGVLGGSIGSIAYAVLAHDIAPVLALPATTRRGAGRSRRQSTTGTSTRRPTASTSRRR